MCPTTVPGLQAVTVRIPDRRRLRKLPTLGALALVASLVAPIASAATRLTTLAQFHGNDAWGMVGNIVPWKGGVIGAATSSSTVNLLTPPTARGVPWQNSILHRFPSFTGDGAYPDGGVIYTAGSVFGATSGGGNTGCSNGCGTVFQLTPPATPGGSWTETQLITFNADNNGFTPIGTLAAQGGKLFGTTIHAANDTVRPGGSTDPVGGVVFQLAPPASGAGPWTETVLYHFDASKMDGDTPFGGLTVGPDKSIYGTTFTGGSCNQGTVFRLTPPKSRKGAWTETLLHEFGATPNGCDYNDGEEPVAGVTLVGSQLYGTTRTGTNQSCGTAFVITLGNPVTYRKIYTFGQFAADACSPQAVLRVDGAGVVYGTTAQGGGAPASTECPYGCGTIFSLTPQPDPAPYTATVLYGFKGGTDGSEPTSNLLGSSTSAMIATTRAGGFATDVDLDDYATFGSLYVFRH